jgi:glycosyltransferase involved in cell wall biosynthesis
MRIVHVATGLITIPPNGWGAVERLTWEYKQGLEKLGDVVEIKYMNELEKWPNTIVHAHLANQALHCKNLGIPYIYSLHDHHVEWYGKDSWVFKQNLEAIKGSIISLTHTEHYLDYFDTTDKLFYIRHGANTEFFIPNYEPKTHRLLMIANNGLAGDSGYDRKGFRYGIEAAKAMNLPITIAGHPDNQKFFDIHSELLAYEKLTLKLTNPTDEEVKELYQTHSIFLHPSMLEAGHPNLTLCEAASACVPIVGTYKGSKHIPGMWVLPSISVETVTIGIAETIKTYDHRRNEMFEARESHSWDVVAKTLHKYYENVLKINEGYTSERTKQLYIDAYDNL